MFHIKLYINLHIIILKEYNIYIHTKHICLMFPKWSLIIFKHTLTYLKNDFYDAFAIWSWMPCCFFCFRNIGLWAGHFAFVERWSSWPARASSFGPGFKKKMFCNPVTEKKTWCNYLCFVGVVETCLCMFISFWWKIKFDCGPWCSALWKLLRLGFMKVSWV